MKPGLPRVLLIDDEPLLAELIRDSLQAVHIECVAALDGMQGLALAQQEQFDLVLLDLGLPGMSGFEVLRKIKQDPRLLQLPVLVLTGWDRIDDKVRAFDEGAADYVTKPFQIVDLMARVQAMVRCVRAEAATQAKSSFLATMSHELRTPLDGVIGAAHRLQETRLNEQQWQLVDTIHHSGQALITLIEDILDFSKIEAGKLDLEKKPFNIRWQIEGVLDVLAPKTSEKNLDLVYFMEDSVPEAIVGDGARLRQVLLNLLGNAVKFTSQGEVVLRVGKLTDSLPTPGIPSGQPVTANANGRWLHFSVQDTGPGISPEKLARLFKPFSQGDTVTARQHGGTGLGLAIGRSLVELMGGKIWVESSPGKGSTFHFSLPATIPFYCQACAKAGCQSSASSVPDGTSFVGPEDLAVFEGCRLLLVEDGPANSDLIAGLLSRWGLSVQTAANSHQALEVLRGQGRFHVVLVDRHLPEKDGLWLAAEIRKIPHCQHLPLILLTTVQQISNLPPAHTAGFAGYATKPVLPSRLQKALVLAMQGIQGTQKIIPVSVGLKSSLAARYPLRLLVVENNEANQQITIMLLRQMGYEAEAVASAQQAMAVLEKKACDLVLLDIQRPEWEDLSVAQMLRQKENQAPGNAAQTPLILIAMTDLVRKEDREKIMAAGMNDYLPMPLDAKELQRMIEKWGRWITQLKPLPKPSSVAFEDRVQSPVQPPTATVSSAQLPDAVTNKAVGAKARPTPGT